MSDLSQESPFWREWAESRHSVQQMREELERLRAENARLLGDHAAALRLVADVRAAIGDDGKRMQPELVEYCKAMKRDAERYRWLRERLQVRTEEMMSGAYKPCLNVRIAYSALTHTSSPRDSYLDPARFDAECAKLDAAIDAAMGGGNG